MASPALFLRPGGHGSPPPPPATIPTGLTPEFLGFRDLPRPAAPRATLDSPALSLRPGGAGRLAPPPASRAAFVGAAVWVARGNGFDGVDIVWRFPASAVEMADFGFLVSDFRAAAPPGFLLTATVYFSNHVFGAGADYPSEALAGSVDWVSVMAFGLRPAGAGSVSFTAFDAPLYDAASHFSASYGVVSWLDAGVPAGKVVMGLPLYGRSWFLRNKANSGVGAPVVAAGPKQRGSNATGAMSYAEVQELAATGAGRAPVMTSYDNAAIAFFLFVRTRVRYAEVREDWEVEYGPHRFSYKQLYKATWGFKNRQLLGTGGFGRVYKGVLPNNNLDIAVKRASHDSKQGMKEFIAEVVSLGHLRQRNLVQLLGYCRRQGELLLVYDCMPNGSIDKCLHDKTKPVLDWGQRFQIIRAMSCYYVPLHMPAGHDDMPGQQKTTTSGSSW